jgi:outer membrane biogenesis lipoprotein LolB
MKRKLLVFVLLSCFLFINGCAVIFQAGRRSDAERIQALEKELERIKKYKRAS